MIRTLHSGRRSLCAALAAGRHVVAAAVSAHHRLLVRLYTAIDASAAVRIRYTDRHGTVSVRDISPRQLRATDAGHITVRAFDWRDGEDTTFRTAAWPSTPPPEEAPMSALPASPLDELVRVLVALDPGQLDHWYGPDADPSEVAADLAARLLAGAPQ